MERKLNRIKFLKVVAAFVVVAVIVCGYLLTIKVTAQDKIGEISVGKDNFIIGLEELKRYKAVNFIYSGKKSILLYNNGAIKAFENICPHKGGPSKLEKGNLVCQWHGAILSAITGEAMKGPAPPGSRLASIALTEQDGKIYVRP